MTTKKERVTVLPRQPAIIRALLESQSGTYGSVVYVKKDGTLKKQTFQRGNDARYILGTERGQRASETFAANNPDMLRLRDVNAIRKARSEGLPPDEADKKGWRTVTLTRVLSARVNGTQYRFE